MYMGTWGPGNMDRDDSREFLDGIVLGLHKVVEDCLKPENFHPGFFLEQYGDIKVMPAIDVIVTLFEHYDHGVMLEKATAKAWKETYLKIYDETAHYYGSSEEHKIQRRRVIEATFERLEELARLWEDF
jgi:hypothetical protein